MVCQAEELLELAFRHAGHHRGHLASWNRGNVRCHAAHRHAHARCRCARFPADGRKHRRWAHQTLAHPACRHRPSSALLPDELASRDIAIKKFSDDGLQLHAKQLRGLASKIKSMQRNGNSRKVETDLEALIEAEGLATRPGPRPKIVLDHMHVLREAIKACRIVELQYRPKNKKSAELKRVCPMDFFMATAIIS